MPSTLLPIALTWTPFGGSAEDLVTANGRYVIRIASGLLELPAYRGTDTVIPGLAGITPRNRVAGIRAIALEGLVAGYGATDADALADYLDAVDELRGWFAPDLGVGTLVATFPDASTRTIEARTRTIVWGPSIVESGRNTVAIELDSVDPHWTIGP